MYDSLAQALVAFLRDNGVVFASLTAVFAATTLIAVARWMRARDQLRAVQDWLLERSKDGDRLDARLHALEGAVDTLAIGVERLNETELFAAKLIADKRATPPTNSADSYRVTTPH
jgi:hypothetical protein